MSGAPSMQPISELVGHSSELEQGKVQAAGSKSIGSHRPSESPWAPHSEASAQRAPYWSIASQVVSCSLSVQISKVTPLALSRVMTFGNGASQPVSASGLSAATGRQKFVWRATPLKSIGAQAWSGAHSESLRQGLHVKTLPRAVLVHV